MASTRSSRSQQLSQKIVVAVDFGTTFSGLAWGRTDKPDDLVLIERWPSSVSRSDARKSERKVPTTLGFQSPPAWGYQLKDTDAKYQWFKLALDPSKRNDSSSLLTNYNAPNAAFYLDADQVDDLVTKYLRALKEHSEQMLVHRAPRLANLLRRFDREYIITIPAIWSEAAKSRTRSCAERAGLGDENSIHVIAEPEAAALYQLVHHIPDLDLKIGDSFVLCDAGGGTVDLISYTITALTPLPQFKEAAPGSGGLCGGTFLNLVFANFLKGTFGSHRRWSSDVLDSAMQHFEREKKSFAGDPEDKLVIPVPELDNSPWIVDGRLVMSSADVAEKIFNPVVDEVIRLVQGQIQATREKTTSIRTVLLVGGFGDSPYLQGKLRTAVGRGITVSDGHNSQTAIVQGALMRGLADAADTVPRIRPPRKARKHYGTQAWDTYDPLKHDLSRSIPDPFNDARIIKVMDWFIRKGDDVKESKPVSFPYEKEKLVSQGRPTSLDVIVYSCEGRENEEAPKYRNSGAGVTELVKLKADLLEIPEADFKREPGVDGREYYLTKFDIEVTYYSATTEYVLVFQGQKYGKMREEYV